MYQSSCKVPTKGYWCRPTIFTGVSQSNRVVQEEIFGPVLAIQTFRTFDEAVCKPNAIDPSPAPSPAVPEPATTDRPIATLFRPLESELLPSTILPDPDASVYPPIATL